MLNPEQKEAVLEIESPLIVIAGPGCGKTTLICEKIAYLLGERGYEADKVLALTFTQKSAEEMTKRVNLKNPCRFSAQTIHSFALGLIDEFYKQIPQIDKDYAVIEEKDQLLFFLEILDEVKLTSVEVGNNKVLLAYEFQNMISKLKDFGVKLMDCQNLEMEDIQNKIDLITIYSKYEQYKKQRNFLDFGDLLLYLLDLLKNNEKVRDDVKNRYKYVLVDEFQDTNKIQLEIIKLIFENNITVVGDPKQSIYGFRGANYKNWDEFRAYFKNYKQIYLHQTYRFSDKILQNTNKIIKHLGDEKQCLRNETGFEGEVGHFECEDENSQDGFVVKKILEIHKKEPSASIGILCRRKHELLSLSNVLKSYGIEHKKINQNSLFDNETIKEILFLLQIVLSPKEANKQIFYLLSNSSLRKETVRKISRMATYKEKSIFNVLEGDDLSEFDYENDEIRKFRQCLDRLICLKNSKANLVLMVKEIVKSFNLYDRAIIGDDRETIMFINHFLKFLQSYLKIYKNNNLEKFLKVCSLAKNLDFDLEFGDDEKGIELLTIHQAKGKEFDYVILPYLNERKMPLTFKTPLFKIPNDISRNEHLLEEHRLFFVAITRAKKGLYTSHIKKFKENKLDSKPSPFVEFLGFGMEKFKDGGQENMLKQSEVLIKKEIFSKIGNYLLSNNFDGAMNEIKLLRSLFGEKTLNSYFMTHPLLESYKKRLKEGADDSLGVDCESQVYSVTQLKTYQSCPRKYLYNYVYKIPSEPKHYFDFGSTLHKVLELIVHEVKNDTPKEILFSKAVSLMEKHWISKGYENGLQEREYYEKGIVAIKNFIEKQLGMVDEKVVDLEKDFIFDIEGKKIRGYIDRINCKDGKYAIYDYKTSNSTENEMQLRENLQLYVYALASEYLYGKTPEKIGLWYLIHDKITIIKTDEIRKEKLKKEILDLINGIESGNFVSNPTFFNCKYCDFNDICPHKK